MLAALLVSASISYAHFTKLYPDMTTHKTVTWTLPDDLVTTIEDFACHQGKSVDETVSSLLNQALQRLTVRGNGRCSLRTGLQSEGPRPLPLQQP